MAAAATDDAIASPGYAAASHAPESHDGDAQPRAAGHVLADAGANVRQFHGRTAAADVGCASDAASGHEPTARVGSTGIQPPFVAAAPNAGAGVIADYRAC